MKNPLYTPKREHDLFGGFNYYASLEPFAHMIYGILGWFSMSVEVFLRRDFGERYLSKMNFLAGFLTLMLVYFWGSIIITLLPSMQGGSPAGLGWVMSAYVVISMFHFFKIMVRNQMGKPLHSLDAGTSRIEWVAKLVLAAINPIAEIVAKAAGKVFLTSGQQERLAASMPIFTDTRAIAERFLEPVIIFLLYQLASSMGFSLLAAWLFISALALAMHTNYAYEAERMQLLDHQDQILEAIEMQRALTGDSQRMRVKENVKQTIQNLAEEMESRPETLQEIEVESPSLADAMAALNPKLRTMATGDES